MDFDEYEYLEQSVEDSEILRKEKKEHRSSRHHRDSETEGGEARESKRSRPDDKGTKADHRRSGNREHNREGDRRIRDRDHPEREREKKDREREMDRERVRERTRRSSSGSKKHDIESGREMERARSRERREREEIALREMDRERRFREKKEIEQEPDPERDQRTVFAYQMPLKATERDAYEFFSKAGKVRDVRLITDRSSRRSKGVGYIEFYDVMSVPMAIALSGHQLFGQPVMVKPSEAEKNLAQSNSSSGALGAAGANKIYVGNLHFNITEDQLRQVFMSFGPVELVQLPLDPETGHCRGYGFVQFSQVEHAKAAQSLNGKLDIAGRIIKVSAVTEHVGMQEPGTNAADFDDDDGGGLSLNARSRALLMQKLDRTGVATSIAETLGVPGLNGTVPNQQTLPLAINGQATMPVVFPALLATPFAEPIGEPSECILLKNMFDPNTETDPDFDLDIKEEVQDECSKFGPLKHIYVDKHSSNGCVYLQFENVNAASTCQRAMHMRWFARRALSATFMRPTDYDAKIRN